MEAKYFGNWASLFFETERTRKSINSPKSGGNRLILFFETSKTSKPFIRSKTDGNSLKELLRRFIYRNEVKFIISRGRATNLLLFRPRRSKDVKIPISDGSLAIFRFERLKLVGMLAASILICSTKSSVNCGWKETLFDSILPFFLGKLNVRMTGTNQGQGMLRIFPYQVKYSHSKLNSFISND